MQQIQAGKIAAKWGKMAQGPPNALIGYPNGLKALIPHFTSQYPIFTSQQALFTVFGASFYFQMQQIRSEKISGKNSFKMIQNGSISPYRAFKAPPML